MLRAFLGANRLVLAGFLHLFVAIGLFESFLVHDYLLGVIHGALLVLAPAIVGMFFLAHSGAIRQYAEFTGEANTRDELTKATRRLQVWGWVGNIEVAGADVDHLVLASCGAIAVDSKWHATHLSPDAFAADARAATYAAGKASSILRSQ